MTRRIRLLVTSIALGALLTGAAVTGAVAAEKKEKEQPQQTLSPKVQKPLVEAQNAIQKQDWNAALTAIQQAQAVPDRKPFDDFQIAEMLGFVQLKLEHFAESAAAFEQSLNSGLLSPDLTHQRLSLVTQLYLQLKNYPKAIEFGNKLLAASPQPDPETLVLLGKAKYLSQDYAGSIADMSRAIDLKNKSGTKAEEDWVALLLSGYVQTKDAKGVLATLKQLAVSYPKKQYITDLFNQWKREPNMDDRLALNLYRVMFHLNLLEYSEDYLKMAQLAVDLGFPGEAITVLNKGNADKKFADEVEQVQYKKQLASANQLAVTDRKTVAGLEQSAATKGTGEELAQLGVAQASYEQYEKAAQSLQAGIAKGGVKRLDQAQIVLGYALVKLNRIDEAQAAFGSVAPDSPLSTVAQLWKAYTVQPSPL